ncbi:MAG: class I SAM-dependent methyltransferase [Gammaproteobacteria bacterium]|nr:class I SAM-dependent methyltransferase [Gammaproteobacteria bacterium]
MNEEVKEYFDNLAHNWGEDEKYSLVKNELENLNIEKGSKILDLACGTGVISNVLQSISGTKLKAIDLSSKMIEEAKLKNHNPNIDFECVDFYEFGEKDYDYIVCYNAYPHFLDLEKFKEKLYETLKSGGKFIIIHSNTKDEINNHHKNCMKVSRILKDSKTESSYYTDLFRIEKLIENDEMYVIIGEKI